MGQVRGALRGAKHDGRAAVGYQGTVEQVQRVGNHARGQHVVDRDLIAHLRGGVARGMGATGHGDAGELLGRGAVFRHVRLGNQRVVGGHSGPIGLFELRVAG